MTPSVRRGLARALCTFVPLVALSLPASAQFGFQQPTGPATAPCVPFGGFPLALNLGQRSDGLDGISSRCGFQRLQDGVNSLAGQRAQPSGIATLDSNGLVPLSQIPGYSSPAIQPGGGAVTVTVAGGTVALDSGQLTNKNIVLTGTLSSGLVVQFPAGIGGEWSVTNYTSGAFTAVAQVAGQSGSLNLLQGYSRSVTSDGTNLNAGPLMPVSTPSSTVPGSIVGWGGTDGKSLVDLGIAPGTAGHVLPFLDGNNTFSGSQTFTGSNTYNASQTFNTVPVLTGSAAPGHQYLPTGSHGYTLGANSTLPGFGLFDMVAGWRFTVLDTNGNFGINTTTPGAKLDVVGDIRGQLKSTATLPTTTDIPQGYWTVVKRSDNFAISICANDAGTIKCSAALQ